jgi:probable phosphoglycerate mutase
MTTHPPQRKTEILARIDGAARGNPGPAAYGVVIETTGGERLATLAKRLGQTTNNFAEYRALLAALEYTLQHRHLRLKVYSDSELLVRQMEGVYKVKSPDLQPLHERARALVAQLEAFTIQYVPREQNREADRLANQALDGAEGSAAATPSARGSCRQPSAALRTSATYQQGLLRPHTELPLDEGETVQIEIHRRRSTP